MQDRRTRRVQRRWFALAAIVVFLLELMIARYVHDQFIRPYVGDVLVVIFVYFVLNAIRMLPFSISVAIAWGCCCLVEMLQWFGLVEILGLSESKLARIVIGTTFSWWDIMAYTAGILLVCVVRICFNYVGRTHVKGRDSHPAPDNVN